MALVGVVVLTAAAIVVTAALATDPVLVDYEYDPVVNTYYTIYREPREWRQASDVCRQDGGHLPSFTSTPDRILLNYIQYTNFNTNHSFQFDVWLGVESSSHGPNERGVYLATNGSVVSADGSRRLPFVCMRAGAECNTTESGYTPGPNGASCYKYHDPPVPARISWLGAWAACRAEDAHLAVPNTRSEFSFINNFTKSKLGGYWLAVGIHDFKADGIFYTMDGKTLLGSGYTGPVDRANGGRCLYMDMGGTLHTYPCETGTSAYLCEKVPTTGPDCSYLLPDVMI